MNYLRKIMILVGPIIVFLFFISVAQAATLYFSPSSGSYNVDQTFSVSIYVSSPDQAINAVSGTVVFSNDKLEVTSLSKSGSIFSLWVQEPSFSNSSGIINFEGIVLNPGFTGSGGKIININFKAKAIGIASLNFSSASVLANDGFGTNILKGFSGANFSIATVKEETTEKTIPTERVNLPPSPIVSSPTHPDPNKWYNLKNAKFNWYLPKDVTAVRLLVGKVQNAIPTVTYIPPISEKEITNLEDGIWYFSIRFRNKAGWGPISHFRFQIDTTPPEPFSIEFIDGKETDNPRPAVIFETTDSLSGIAYYKVKIGEGDFSHVTPEIVKGNPYILPPQTPGKKTILVQAFDKAGNSQIATEEFVILPLKPPVITNYPKQLPSGETLIIKGTTKYPNAQTIVWFESEGREPKSQIIRNDSNGNFMLIAEEKLKDGIYKIWAEVIDERGARSTPSEKIIISVEPPTFLKIGNRAITILSVVVPFVALIILLLVIIWSGWRRFSLFQKKIYKETEEAKETLHQTFTTLKEEIDKQVAKLDGQPDLNEREKEVCDNLKRVLKICERMIAKEIRDIEKEIKK
ncbi:MAG: hypothetical protein ACK413_01525 [Patescibacteria group bacterium]